MVGDRLADVPSLPVDPMRRTCQHETESGRVQTRRLDRPTSDPWVGLRWTDHIQASLDQAGLKLVRIRHSPIRLLTTRIFC